MTAKQTIEAGKAILGIEFGSTRIKAVLIDEQNKPIAQGSHEWENQLVDGLWTYSTEAIWYGLQDCYAELRKDVQKQYDCEIEALAAIGFNGNFVLAVNALVCRNFNFLFCYVVIVIYTISSRSYILVESNCLLTTFITCKAT